MSRDLTLPPMDLEGKTCEVCQSTEEIDCFVIEPSRYIMIMCGNCADIARDLALKEWEKLGIDP